MQKGRTIWAAEYLTTADASSSGRCAHSDISLHFQRKVAWMDFRANQINSRDRLIAKPFTIHVWYTKHGYQHARGVINTCSRHIHIPTETQSTELVT